MHANENLQQNEIKDDHILASEMDSSSPGDDLHVCPRSVCNNDKKNPLNYPFIEGRSLVPDIDPHEIFCNSRKESSNSNSN